MIGGIVLTHGQMASAIVEAAGTIIGKTEKIFTISTSEYSLRSLIAKLEKLISDEKFDQGVIIMASLKGGTCWNVAVAVARKFPTKVEVVSGVNLNMFISFVTKREQFELSKLAEIIYEDGIRGIELYKIN